MKYKHIKDQKGNVVIWQWPNLPLWVVFGLWVINYFLNSAFLSWTATFVLFYWAYLEITDGDSDFRKLLGWIVIIYQFIKILALFF